jgi:hypothetical protein
VGVEIGYGLVGKIGQSYGRQGFLDHGDKEAIIKMGAIIINWSLIGNPCILLNASSRPISGVCTE